MTPGPIAVNSATFVGIKIAGIPGALIATLGCILPSCIIVTVIAKLYLRYRELDMLQGILNSLRPAVVAMIASAGISILITAFWGTSESENEPCLGYGGGRSYESGSIIPWRMIPHSRQRASRFPVH